MRIQISDTIADEVGLRLMAARDRDQSEEYPVTGHRMAWAPRKGTKKQTQWRVPVYTKANRNLLAQIAFVKGGKVARDKIYPMRHVLFA